MTKPDCPKCKGTLGFIPADIMGPDRIKCMQCGWYIEKVESKSIEDIEKEHDMSIKGTCVKCGRVNLTLPGGGLCGRCYQQKRDAEKRPIPGRTPTTEPEVPAVKDVEEVKPLRAHDVVKPAKKERVKADVATASEAATVNLMQIIDTEWKVRREIIAEQFESNYDPYLMLVRAHNIINSMRSL